VHETGPRIPPVTFAEATPEQKELMGQWNDMHWVSVGINHPELFKVANAIPRKVISNSDLPPRDREVVVLRTLQLCNENYELTHNVALARNVGMTDAEINAARSADGEVLSTFGRTLVRAAEELVRDQRIGDRTWEELSERYSRIQLMEVVGLVGGYVMMAMMTKSFDIEVEDDETFNNFMTKRDYVEREHGVGAAGASS
jgi:4-carboxymuconolactone decarboxylase